MPVRADAKYRREGEIMEGAKMGTVETKNTEAERAVGPALSTGEGAGCRAIAHGGSRTGRGGLLALLAFLGLIVIPGCGNVFETEVEGDRNEVDADDEFTLAQTMVGATASLFQAYDLKIVWAGLVGDEFVSSGTAPGIQQWDRRMVDTDCCEQVERTPTIGSPNYVLMQQASKVNDLAQERMLAGEFRNLSEPAQDAPEFARVSSFEGFAKVWLADLFCTVAFDGTGPELTSREVYELAEMEFTRAIEAANAEPEIRQAALVGRARVRLFLGDEQAALADAQEVDPEFLFEAEYSSNSFEEQNMIEFRTWDFGNWSVGPPFRGLEIDDTGQPDPRVELVLDPQPAFEPSQPLLAPVKAESEAAPIAIASGDEAQYMIAEIVGGQEAVEIINEVRARNGIDVEWQPETGSAEEIRDKVIDERRRTLFLEGVRFPDLRRYIDKFDLNFFPTSTPQGFPMGNQTCVPLPDIERNNNPDI